MHLALFVANRKVIPGAVVEIADPGDTHAVVVDHCPRHDGNFRPPRSMMRWQNRYPPRNHASKQYDEDGECEPAARQPKEPDRDKRKAHRQGEPRCGPWQVREIDDQGAPGDEQKSGTKSILPCPTSGKTRTGSCGLLHSLSPAENDCPKGQRHLATLFCNIAGVLTVEGIQRV